MEATGPIPITDGSTPPRSPATQVASGVTPSSLAFSSVITTIAAAPSLIVEALPAVTVPSFLNAGRSLPRLSAVVLALIPSSLFTMIVSFLVLTSTSTISASNLPAACAAAAFCWLAAANASISSLEIFHCSAIFSAVIPMW